MPARPSDPEDNGHPSDLALKNAREIGQLSTGLLNLEGEVVSIARKMDTGFSEVGAGMQRLSDRVTKPPNVNVYLGVGALLLAGIPLIAGIIFFTVTSTVAPISGRLQKIEQQVDTMNDTARDDFELLIRVDQVLIDRGLKTNETDTALQAMKKKPKTPKS